MKHLFSSLAGVIFLMLYLRTPAPTATTSTQGDFLAPITQMLEHMAHMLTIAAIVAGLIVVCLGLLIRVFRSP